VEWESEFVAFCVEEHPFDRWKLKLAETKIVGPDGVQVQIYEKAE
jgi:hypothetical protein